MTFAETKPIYRQIAERLEDEVLAGQYAEGERVPGVREYAALLQVNVNTVARAFETLAQEDLIHQQRGMGYFVTKGAAEAVRSRRRAKFLAETVPAFLSDMRKYGLTPEQIFSVNNTQQ